MTRLELVAKLTGEFGQPLVVLPWWTQAFEALDAPNIRELLFWLMRQTGKSQLLAAMLITELLLRPGSYSLFVSASDTQAGAIFTRKVRRPLERLSRALGKSVWRMKLTKRGVEVPALGSVLEIICPNEATAPARSPTLLCMDEARYIPDEVYSVLVPSLIGGNGKLVVASTAGQPKGFFYELTRNQCAESWMYTSLVNDNPHASQGMLGFLRRRLALLLPSAGRRELGNEFTEDGDALLRPDLIEAAVDDDWQETVTSDLPAWVVYDLSRKRDLTSRVVILRDRPRRPEATDHLVVASLAVWDPKLSPTGEVNFAEVRADMADLPRRYPSLQKIQVDEGAEAGSILPFAKSHPALTLRTEGLIVTAETNIALWGALSARLHAGTLTIPRHERLLAELKNLRQESFAFGAKWRVVDSSRKFHRDVSFSLAGAVCAAGTGILAAGGGRDVDEEWVQAGIPKHVAWMHPWVGGYTRIPRWARSDRDSEQTH